jgi:hypothetical protein
MNSATSRFWGRAHNDVVEGDRRALEDRASPLESASREKWVSVA